MRYFTVFLFFIVFINLGYSQEKTIVRGTILNDISFAPMGEVDIINLTKVKPAISKPDGTFKIEANINDSIHFSHPGYISIKILVTNDWINDDNLKIYLTENSYLLNEIVINKYHLTGFLEVDTKLIELNDKLEYNRFRQNNNSLYFSTSMGGYYRPIDAVYNLFKGKAAKLKKINSIKKDQNMIALMQSRYDRETVCGLLGITQSDIVKTLQNCNNSDRFIYTATDYQIYIALNECYEQAKILTKEDLSNR